MRSLEVVGASNEEVFQLPLWHGKHGKFTFLHRLSAPSMAVTRAFSSSLHSPLHHYHNLNKHLVAPDHLHHYKHLPHSTHHHRVHNCPGHCQAVHHHQHPIRRQHQVSTHHRRQHSFHLSASNIRSEIYSRRSRNSRLGKTLRGRSKSEFI
ncbi:hypothetical protein KP509_24G013300 [Ceratopteris richardii]|uniref:Uncharacterized protein n=1 Tax=Ceratopteris richardii TaxID=49495 RepID=A0A8T2RU79_CERRI|nr:hypothetical protein KP509_24G013300 [Ceratopteris richardii]